MRCIFLLFFALCLLAQTSYGQTDQTPSLQKNDEGASWLGTSFNPFTYEHNPPVIDLGSYILDEGSDFREQTGVQSIFDRQTHAVQTFREVSTVDEYYKSTSLEVSASGGFSIFSGSANFKETQTFNHSDLRQHRMFIGQVKETVKFLVFDHNGKNLSSSWSKRFDQLFNVVSKIKDMCDEFDIENGDVFQKLPEFLGKCIPLRLSVSLMNGMLKDGAWIVTGVKLGGVITIRTTLDAQQVSTLTTKQITDGVSAKFGSFFSGSYSQTTNQQTLNEVSTSITFIERVLVGGEGSFNDTETEFPLWSKTIYSKPAVIGVKEVILCDLITFDRFSEIDPSMVAFVQSLCLSQITTLVDLNTPTGCAIPTNKMFDPNVLKSGHCDLDTNYTFGGFVQTAVSSLSQDPQATCQKTVYASPKPQNNQKRELCPEGWYPMPIMNSSLLVPSFYKSPDYNQCWHTSGGWFHSGHTVCPCRINSKWAACHWYDVPFSCSIQISVCVKNRTTTKGSAFSKHCGGFYTLQQDNPLTGSPSCPSGFKAVPLLNHAAFSCEAYPGSVDEKLAVPFGGVYSGNVANVFTKKQECPRGHSRYYMGSFFGVPWYFCMAYRSPYQPQTFRYLPTMPPMSLIVSWKNKTINLGKKTEFRLQTEDKWFDIPSNLFQPLLFVGFAILCLMFVVILVFVVSNKISLRKLKNKISPPDANEPEVTHWNLQSQTQTEPLIANSRKSREIFFEDV